MMSLLCYGGSAALAAEDVAQMLQLMVLIKHGRVFLDPRHFQQNPELLPLLDQLHLRCQSLMCSRADAVMQHAWQQPRVATEALQAVLQQAPGNLSWQGVKVAATLAASLQSEGSDGHLYSINLLDGSVLQDGMPPSRLPCEITGHHMFRWAVWVDASKGIQ
jgi:hypothetical protein